MKRKLVGIATATMIFAGGAIYAFNNSETECDLKGTAECPLVQDCPLQGTPNCPLVENAAKVVTTAALVKTEELPDCCKKK